MLRFVIKFGISSTWKERNPAPHSYVKTGYKVTEKSMDCKPRSEYIWAKMPPGHPKSGYNGLFVQYFYQRTQRPFIARLSQPKGGLSPAPRRRPKYMTGNSPGYQGQTRRFKTISERSSYTRASPTKRSTSATIPSPASGAPRSFKAGRSFSSR